MGLVQRVIEAAGISTISLSPMPDWTEAYGPPRLAGVAHPTGLTIGPPDYVDHQRAVVRATLQALSAIKRPGGRIDLPFEWPDSARNIEGEPDTPPPIVTSIIRRPWLLRRLMAGDIPPPE